MKLLSYIILIMSVFFMSYTNEIAKGKAVQKGESVKEKKTELINDDFLQKEFESETKFKTIDKISNEIKINSKRLTPDEIKTIFTKDVIKNTKILNSFDKVYEYNDKSGKHYIVVTRKTLEIKKEIAFNNEIRVYNLKADKNKFLIEWELKDFTNSKDDEKNIWFWAKWFKLDDFDNDGLIDPIIVYGTTTDENGSVCENGKIKILTYYNGKKNAIRHKNCVTDDCRETTFDDSVLKLPKEIKEQLTEIMNDLTEKNLAIFTKTPE